MYLTFRNCRILLLRLRDCFCLRRCQGRRIRKCPETSDEVSRILKILNEKHLVGVISRVTGNSMRNRFSRIQNSQTLNCKACPFAWKRNRLSTGYLCCSNHYGDTLEEQESVALNFTIHNGKRLFETKLLRLPLRNI